MSPRTLAGLRACLLSQTYDDAAALSQPKSFQITRGAEMKIGSGCVVTAMIMFGTPLPAFPQTAGFDGVYRGEPTSGTGCSTFTPVLRVEKGVARLRYNPNTTFEGDVAAGGALDAPFGQGRLTGKFADGKFQGFVSNGRCQYPLALQK